MAIPQRDVAIKSVFAEDANTTIPTPPVSGISYRDTEVTQEEIANGWPFKEIVDSSKFNQAMYEYSTITKMIEKYGFLPWSNSTDYEEGSYALGTNGTVYRAVQATGPSTTAFNPVDDTTATYWETWLDSMDLMVGDIKASARSANHGSWILCNGQAISRTTYAKLFSIIGTNFGQGDGVNTFNVPDYRGKFLRGLGGDSASNMYATQAEGLPNITGSINAMYRIGGPSGAFYQSGGGSTRHSGSSHTPEGDYFQFNASRSSSIYGKSSHVTPINMAVNYFIRAK